ncbi:SRPBCC family protein [Lutimonas vermicola]|uniref:SRPBCC family protein n=1 Tax=Lutimonas vermicola TaxID=414288 RepID=A0ABU9KZJ5_9FLAO
MNFEKQGQIYQLSATIQVPIDIDEAWEFLSDPSNLKVITPDYMGFHILSATEPVMYSGQIISYTVSPLLGVKLNWVTEITHVDDKKYFVDEQRIGPYAMWHHKHFLKEIENGTEIRDVVHYKLPLPLIANRFHSILVKPKLKEIFKYRSKALVSMFGKYHKS